MAKYTNPLDHVTVAAPCSADWDEMIGDERARFCGLCKLSVYNLSGMTRREAEALIAGAEGRLCVRYYRRADGTILTDNCPVGLRAIKRRLSRIASATLSTVLGFFAGLGLYTAFDERHPAPVRTMGAIAVTPLKVEAPPEHVLGMIATDQPTVFDGRENGEWVKGEMARPLTDQSGGGTAEGRDSGEQRAVRRKR